MIHSATKFINGHSDVVAGLVITNDEKWHNQIKLQQKVLGGILGVEDCWLTMRGLKTMALRMEQSARSAEKISQMLENHPAIQKVHYPGLSNHPGYDIHKRQATSGGAVLSFVASGSIEFTVATSPAHRSPTTSRTPLRPRSIRLPVRWPRCRAMCCKRRRP